MTLRHSNRLLHLATCKKGVTIRLKDGQVINQTGVCRKTLREFLDVVRVCVAKGLMIIEGDLRSVFTVRATVERGELAFVYVYARPNQRSKNEPSRRARRQRMIELQMRHASA